MQEEKQYNNIMVEFEYLQYNYMNTHNLSIIASFTTVLLVLRVSNNFANFVMVDQFAKSAKPKLLLVNTHDPCQNAIVRSQRVKFSALIWLIRKSFIF